MLYDWGYSQYANPYYSPSTVVVVQQPGYDYTQPLNPGAAAPAQSATDQANLLFDQARETFKGANYASALSLVDQALAQLPNDPSLHEFRALILFSMGRFEEAATPLYAVLTAGPGWDWATVIGLYADSGTYTRQFRALESYVQQNPQSAAAHFVLAYHYLVQSHTVEAVTQLREASRLQPKDTVSAQLLQYFETMLKGPAAGPATGSLPSSAPTPGAAPSAAPAPGAVPPAFPAPGAQAQPAQLPATATGKEGTLDGTWTASPAPGTQITLTFPDASHFTWKVSDQGKMHEFQGDRTYGNGILTLAQGSQVAGQPPMVGRLTWVDENHFTFKVIAGPPNDPGLSFTKSP
jgi:tetratricopeptide (TPR) repeat protein